MHAAYADRDGRARGAENRSGHGRTKKRRRGGGVGASASTTTSPTGASDYRALIPEDEWCYVVTEIARTFGQDWWDTYWSRPHGKPHLTWFAFYHLAEAQRIDELRREIDDLDRAVLMANAVNAPKGLDERRKELRYRLRNDPRMHAAPKWSKQEMHNAASRLMASVLKKPGIQ